MIMLQHEQCYEIVMNALRTLKGVGKVECKVQLSHLVATVVDPFSRSKYIKQIIQLSVRWPETVFHEHLYRTLLEFGLENELLEYGGSDLVSFLQSAGRKHQEELSPNPCFSTKIWNYGYMISTFIKLETLSGVGDNYPILGFVL
jgi:nuclear pore complex protein Nup155